VLVVADMDQEMRSFVIFRLGDEEYGLSIDNVQSIVRYEESTPVPRSPEAIQGVVNLRGQVIPVLDLSMQLRNSSIEQSALSRIIVAEGEGGVIGLAVDAANEVASIPTASIQPPPEAILTAETAQAFEGVAERESGLVILIDLDSAVPKTEYAHVAAAQAGGEGGSDV
jgi:purine-binding chemotaxis protein CheW